MLQLSEVSKVYDLGRYKVTAVDNATIQVGKEDFILIAGRSGCGKTTLLSLMAGLTKPSHGTVKFKGTDIWTLSDQAISTMRNREIGFIFQFPSLIPTLNVFDNIRLVSTFQAADHDASNRVRNLLDQVGMSEKAEAYPNELSGGQQKRVAVARALLNTPGLILADEPTADLDEETEIEILELLRKVCKNQAAVVLVSHNPSIVSFATRRFEMRDGLLTEKNV